VDSRKYMREYMRERRKDKSFRKKALLATKKWRKNNKEKIKKTQKEWLNKNPRVFCNKCLSYHLHDSGHVNEEVSIKRKTKKAIANKKYRKAHPEKIKNSINSWIDKNRSEYNKKRKKYTLINREKVLTVKRKSQKKYRKNNPLKTKAHNLINKLLKDKTIFKKPCEVCGELKVNGHHEDYSKPHVVIWLCKDHHAERHRIIRKEKLLER
jgi:hypothetical protein